MCKEDQLNQSSLTPLIVIALVLSALVAVAPASVAQLAATAAPADAGACLQTSSGAESCTVNMPGDGHDAVPDDGRCEMTPGGSDCSLRAAIEETNSHTAPCNDSVVLPGQLEPYVLRIDASLEVNGCLIVRGSAKAEATGQASVIDGDGRDGIDSGRPGAMFSVSNSRRWTRARCVKTAKRREVQPRRI